MLNLIQADLYKLSKTSIIKILFAITTVCALAMTAMAFLIPQGKIDSSLSGVGFMFSDINMISILGGVIAAVLICGDIDSKTIHASIANGYSRTSIITSKAIVFSCALIFILLPYAVITSIALSIGSEFNMGSVAIGFLHLLTSTIGVAISASGIWKLLAVILTLLIVHIAQLSITIPLAFIFKKPILVVAIYYGFSILIAQLISLSKSSQLFDSIFSYTPYGGNYSFVTLNTATEDLVKAIAVCLVFIIGVLIITSIAFRKSELK